jgi:hypothetical protein
MLDLPPELSGLELPQYRLPMISKEPVELPWKTDAEWDKWLSNPIWRRKAFTADKDHLNSVLMSKPIGSLLSMAYLKSVRHHVHRNGLSYLASFTGPHRTSKSTSACLFAHFWDPTFWDSFEQRVIQSPFQFATTMNNIIDDEIIGAAVVVDEAGTTFSSGDWYEKWMKVIQKFLQTCGMLKPIILFVAPNREFIVSGMRKLIIAEHHLKKFDPKFARMSCYHVKYNFMKKGDPYIFKRPLIRIAGQNITLKHINIYAPPDWFIDRYRNLTEPDKRERMKQWTNEVQQVIAGQENEGEPDYDTIIEDIWGKKHLFFGRKTREGYQTIEQTEIEVQYKIKPKYAKLVKDRIERRLAEYQREQADMDFTLKEKEAQKIVEDTVERTRKMKTQLVDELAPPKTEERKEQKEKMSKDLEDMLSSLDD